MKTSVAIQCIVLLACMALCTSLIIPRCRCLNTSKSVRGPITEVKVDEPRPYCNRREVIVTLKDGSERCLDPQSKFTIMLLEKLNQMKNTTVSPYTTTASAAVPESS
ncbi:C-X-C motif chemokine 3-like isoform X2 [Pundamilia nyererei]|uniref:C-X-C motif chemokine 3-like isoform X2 n=1 Tax=Pundamilia nyererei TaxID=303518 RepID=A0A9Y3RY58_9CICH|nr:PREDICTED: C-X-C motif chemokine 3-like isoform X2 [Pundamilia nyererei]